MAALACIAAFIVAGCDDGDGSTNASRTPAEMLEWGWNYFEAANYSSALNEFESALRGDPRLSDAQNGAGWAVGRIPGRLNEAPARFAAALSLDTTRYDALGGWAFAIYQLGQYGEAIAKSDSLLRRRPGWRFLHEPTLDQNDLRLMQAACHYNLGDYTASYRKVVDFLNPSFEADVSTPAGRRELLDEIERLRRVYG